MQTGNGWSVLPPVVKNLLIINGLMLLATYAFAASTGIDLRDILGLHLPGSEKFQIYQVVSYMFMHGDLTHLLFNMFAVWLFGSSIENTWGSKRFLTYYVLTGFGAAFLHYVILYIDIAPTINAIEALIINPEAASIFAFLEGHQLLLSSDRFPEITRAYIDFNQNGLSTLSYDPQNEAALREARNFFSSYLEHYKSLPNVVGASGSLFGILIAFGMMFPNVRMYLLFLPIPIKAKWLVTAYGVAELFSAFQDNGDNVAHFAHLGGMLFGFLIIKFWQKTGSHWR